MLCTAKLCDNVTAELKTHGTVMQMAAPGKRSYAKLTQKRLFSTVVSSLDMHKQLYSGVKMIPQCGHHMNA